MRKSRVFLNVCVLFYPVIDIGFRHLYNIPMRCVKEEWSFQVGNKINNVQKIINMLENNDFSIVELEKYLECSR